MKRCLLCSLLLTGIILLSGCRPCEYQTVDLGPLPEEILNKVPYQNGRQYSLKHSEGQIISFSAIRYTQQEKDFPYHDCWLCSDCNGKIYIHEINTTKLSPNYPIFDISLVIKNESDSNYHCAAQIGTASFFIPVQFSDTAFWGAQAVDSVQVGNTYYKQVFKLKDLNDYWYRKDSIRVDSLYYNYDQGILLIKMTNHEYYAKYE